MAQTPHLSPSLPCSLLQPGLGWNWKFRFSPTCNEHCFLGAYQTWVELKAPHSSNVWWAPFSLCTSDVGRIKRIRVLPHLMSPVSLSSSDLGGIESAVYVPGLMRNWKHCLCFVSEEHVLFALVTVSSNWVYNWFHWHLFNITTHNISLMNITTNKNRSKQFHHRGFVEEISEQFQEINFMTEAL